MTGDVFADGFVTVEDGKIIALGSRSNLKQVLRMWKRLWYDHAGTHPATPT